MDAGEWEKHHVYKTLQEVINIEAKALFKSEKILILSRLISSIANDQASEDLARLELDLLGE